MWAFVNILFPSRVFVTFFVCHYLRTAFYDSNPLTELCFEISPTFFISLLIFHVSIVFIALFWIWVDLIFCYICTSRIFCLDIFFLNQINIASSQDSIHSPVWLYVLAIHIHVCSLIKWSFIECNWQSSSSFICLVSIKWIHRHY